LEALSDPFGHRQAAHSVRSLQLPSTQQISVKDAFNEQQQTNQISSGAQGFHARRS